MAFDEPEIDRIGPGHSIAVLVILQRQLERYSRRFESKFVAASVAEVFTGLPTPILENLTRQAMTSSQGDRNTITRGNAEECWSKVR